MLILYDGGTSMAFKKSDEIVCYAIPPKFNPVKKLENTNDTQQSDFPSFFFFFFGLGNQHFGFPAAMEIKYRKKLCFTMNPYIPEQRRGAPSQWMVCQSKFHDHKSLKARFKWFRSVANITLNENEHTNRQQYHRLLPAILLVLFLPCTSAGCTP